MPNNILLQTGNSAGQQADTVSAQPSARKAASPPHVAGRGIELMQCDPHDFLKRRTARYFGVFICRELVIVEQSSRERSAGASRLNAGLFRGSFRGLFRGTFRGTFGGSFGMSAAAAGIAR